MAKRRVGSRRPPSPPPRPIRTLSVSPPRPPPPLWNFYHQQRATAICFDHAGRPPGSRYMLYDMEKALTSGKERKKEKVRHTRDAQLEVGRVQQLLHR